MRTSIAPLTRCAAAAVTAVLLTAPLHALAANHLTNGDFETHAGGGQVGVNTSVTGWTAGGQEGVWGNPTNAPVFLMPNGAAAQSGVVTGSAFMGTVAFYGGVTDSPSGGSFIAADGDSDFAGSISQTVNGLTIGQNYTLTFNWAGAQQAGFGGATTEAWQVTFGGDTQTTPIVNVASQSWSGWQNASMTFMAASTSSTLTFLAKGEFNGQAPWLLLDGVQLTEVSAVPEPESALMMAVGLAGLGLRLRARRKKA